VPGSSSRTIVFREAGQPDQLVPMITPYLELPAKIERDRRTWIYSAQEGKYPIFRQTDEDEVDVD
jgi:hypothetical protein